MIRERIRAALSRGERLELSVGDFARAIEREAQEGLYELRQELNLDRAALSRLFGDGERAAKQISAWGEASRERPRIRSLRG